MGDRRPGGPLTEDPVFDWVYIDDEEPQPDEITDVVVDTAADSRFNKYHAKDGKFSSSSSGGAGTVTVPIKDQNGVVLGSFELDRSKPMQPQVDAALKKLGMGGAKHSVVKDAPAPGPAKQPAKKPTPAKATAANKPEKVEGITTGDGKHVKVIDAKESTRYESPKNLTKDEKDAIYRYTDHGYEESNSLLRYGNWSKFPSTRKLQEEDIANVRSAIAKSTLKEDVLVHRMVNYEALGFKKSVRESEIVGKVVADKAFMSTTTNREGMKGTPYSKNPIQMNIRVPKGTNALYLGDPGMSKWHDEKELLLGDGTKLAILGAKYEGGLWQVDAQVVP